MRLPRAGMAPGAKRRFNKGDGMDYSEIIRTAKKGRRISLRMAPYLIAMGTLLAGGSLYLLLQPKMVFDTIKEMTDLFEIPDNKKELETLIDTVAMIAFGMGLAFYSMFSGGIGMIVAGIGTYRKSSERDMLLELAEYIERMEATPEEEAVPGGEETGLTENIRSENE